MNVEQIRVIERLRQAAKEHGEVHDLLMVLSNALLIDASGNQPSFVGDAGDAAYLKAALLAACFVLYDGAKDV